MEWIHNGNVPFHTYNQKDQDGRCMTQAVGKVVHFAQQPAKLPTETFHFVDLN